MPSTEHPINKQGGKSVKYNLSDVTRNFENKVFLGHRLDKVCKY